MIVRKQSVLVVGQFGLLPRRSDLLLGTPLSPGTNPDLSHPKTHLLDNDKNNDKAMKKTMTNTMTQLLPIFVFCTFILLYFCTFALKKNPKERWIISGFMRWFLLLLRLAMSQNQIGSKSISDNVNFLCLHLAPAKYVGSEQARKLQDAQAEKLTSWEAHKLANWQADKSTTDKLTSWKIYKLPDWQEDKRTRW